MLVNADFSQPVAVTPGQYRWTASPEGGVDRVMLDRVGAEQARATSIVRYAPGSHFSRHEHPGGEEILVLSGTFSDEASDFGTGWYVRNPPGSAHRPHSDDGAVIFVKLRQMGPDDDRHVRVDTTDAARWHALDDRTVCPLFVSDAEEVALHAVEAGRRLLNEHVPGAELLVVAGELVANGRRYPLGSWIRLPAGRHPEYTAGDTGATFYVKIGALGLHVP